MMMMIKPGFYPEMPGAEYRALKALAASGVDALVNECPWKFWQESPWNPAFEQRHHEAFDLGTAAHLAVLEPAQFDERVFLIGAADYKTKAAQAARDEAYIAGKTPLTVPQHTIVGGMARAIFEQAGSYFVDGYAECTLVWDWDGVLCKARPDYWRRDKNREYIIDLKTTTTTNPRVIAQKAFREGWHCRAVWYMEGLMQVVRNSVPRYIFVVVETAPPHLIQIFELDERALAWGQQLVRRGLRLFRDCMERGDWPAYGSGVQKLGLPTFAEYQLADRDAAGEFSDKMLPGEMG
jgi:hypothetical protein